ncbi:MAG: cyclic nucleotide-binding domain-containing protein [Devosia sp.]
MPDISALWVGLLRGLTDPAILFGHFTYFLLIVSMLMRRMIWLRAFAILSGTTKILYRAVLVVDPVSVLWETVFTLVNIGQLVLIWYYEYHHRFAEEENHFADSMPAGIERGAIKRLLELSELVRAAPGEKLTIEGEPVTSLIYVADGIVQIERGDRIVAICGPGDYVGELSFLSGDPASATASVVKPARLLSFSQDKLRTATAANPELRRTLESALNRNLAGKLVRTNGAEIPT